MRPSDTGWPAAAPGRTHNAPPTPRARVRPPSPTPPLAPPRHRAVRTTPGQHPARASVPTDHLPTAASFEPRGTAPGLTYPARTVGVASGDGSCPRPRPGFGNVTSVPRGPFTNSPAG